MEHWLGQIIQMLPEGAPYLAVLFFVALFESLPLIGLLMPGSSLIVLAGFLAFHGKTPFLELFIIAACGALLGDLISFWLGSAYGSKLLKIRTFRKHHRLVTRSEQFFVDHGGKSIFFARFLGPIRGITPFIAGLSAMSKRAFYCYTAISSVLWGLCYPGLGYLGGQSWQYAQSITARFGLAVLILLILVFIHHRIRKKIKV